ncbi:hypothetical protein [Paracoccus sp. (in: a-proteobacteria)]|uniref:hypothetical protein n=1 Tax=Paracoccus sp. TaxID=267 RepID=UPI00321FF650
MEDKLAAQEETIAALQKQVESIPDLMKKISELTAAQRANAIESAVDKVVLPSIPEKPISYNKKKYKWVLPVFSLPGVGRVTAEEAATDEGIVKAILDIDGQGILRELV